MHQRIDRRLWAFGMIALSGTLPIFTSLSAWYASGIDRRFWLNLLPLLPLVAAVLFLFRSAATVNGRLAIANGRAQPHSPALANSLLEKMPSSLAAFLNNGARDGAYRISYVDGDISVDDGERLLGILVNVFVDYCCETLEARDLIHFHAVKPWIDDQEFSDFLWELNERGVGVIYTFTTVEGHDHFWQWWAHQKRSGRDLRNVIGIQIHNNAIDVHQARLFKMSNQYECVAAFDTVVDNLSGRSRRYYLRMDHGIHWALTSCRIIQENRPQNGRSDVQSIVNTWYNNYIENFPSTELTAVKGGNS